MFLSNFINKIDNKGRVSLPAQFRANLEEAEKGSIIIYQSFVNSCIEGCSLARIKKIAEAIDKLDPFSEERDIFATTVLGCAIQLSIDSDGRIIIPSELIKTSEIKDNVVFVGKGTTFEIWQTEKFNRYLENAKIIAKEKRNLLKI